MELIVALIIAAIFLLAPEIEEEMVVQTPSTEPLTENDWRKALREQAIAHGVNPDIADAIGGTESNWQPAVNNTGGDALRGGSWGPTQISQQTARAHGYREAMEKFNENPTLAGEWTARILAARPGGPPATLIDAAGWWNAGRVITGEGEWFSPEKGNKTNSLPTSTLIKYLPRLAANYTYVTSLAGLEALV